MRVWCFYIQDTGSPDVARMQRPAIHAHRRKLLPIFAFSVSLSSKMDINSRQELV